MGDGPAAATPRAHGADFATAAEIVLEPVMDAVFTVPDPRNEPVRDYAPGSPERESLKRRLTELAGERLELTMTIDGAQRMASGAAIDVVQPHRHQHVLGVTHNASNADAEAAVTAAKQAAPMWRCPAVRGTGRDLPARGRPAGRSVARHAQRRHHAGSVEDVHTRQRSTRPAS